MKTRVFSSVAADSITRFSLDSMPRKSSTLWMAVPCPWSVTFSGSSSSRVSSSSRGSASGVTIEIT